MSHRQTMHKFGVKWNHLASKAAKKLQKLMLMKNIQRSIILMKTNGSAGVDFIMSFI